MGPTPLRLGQFVLVAVVVLAGEAGDVSKGDGTYAPGVVFSARNRSGRPEDKWLAQPSRAPSGLSECVELMTFLIHTTLDVQRFVGRFGLQGCGGPSDCRNNHGPGRAALRPPEGLRSAGPSDRARVDQSPPRDRHGYSKRHRPLCDVHRVALALIGSGALESPRDDRLCGARQQVAWVSWECPSGDRQLLSAAARYAAPGGDTLWLAEQREIRPSCEVDVEK